MELSQKKYWAIVMDRDMDMAMDMGTVTQKTKRIIKKAGEIFLKGKQVEINR